MGKKLTKEEKVSRELEASCARAEWLSHKIWGYLEGDNGLTHDQLYEEEDDDKHMAMRHKIASAIGVDFDEVDNAISEMFF